MSCTLLKNVITEFEGGGAAPTAPIWLGPCKHTGELKSGDRLERFLADILLQLRTVLATNSRHVLSSLTSTTRRRKIAATSRDDARLTITARRISVATQQQRNQFHTAVTSEFDRGRQQSQRHYNSSAQNTVTSP